MTLKRIHEQRRTGRLVNVYIIFCRVRVKDRIESVRCSNEIYRRHYQLTAFNRPLTIGLTKLRESSLESIDKAGPTESIRIGSKEVLKIC